MRKLVFLLIFFCLAVAGATYAPIERAASQGAPQNQPPAPAQAPPQTTSAVTAPPATPPPAPPAPAAPVLTIVLDPAHGGADNGARGPNGLNEKDVVLALARGIRAELTQRGYRVVMTRDSDADPTYDDRAAMANQFADAIFVSFHVASTGTAGTVRVYYYRFSAPFTYTSALATGEAPSPPQPVQIITPGAGGLVPWRQAQRGFDDASHRFADLVQTSLQQKFSASPSVSISAADRDLRSIAAPAIAVELSSVASLNASSLEAMGPSVAYALAQSIPVFQPESAPNNGTPPVGATH